MEKMELICGGRPAALYTSEKADAPLILLNCFGEEGAEVAAELEKMEAPACHLLVVGDLDWNHDMTPWECPPVMKGDQPYTGGAEDHLQRLLTEVLPEARARIGGAPRFTGIAGYSLAGLFALYALYRCEAFDRAASMSGSLWYPKFKDYVFSHSPQKRPEKLYLSLGDKEAKTRNTYMRTVQEDTEAIVSHFREAGLDVAWELNPGNHFRDAEVRTAKGIRAILE